MIGIINDTHLDVKRVGGTTENSREALQVYVLIKFRELLIAASEMQVLIILGDLFNREKVDNWVFLQTLRLIEEFLDNTPDCQLILVRGNHDSRSKDRENLCSLELLAQLLGDRIVFIFEEPYQFKHDGVNHLIIPHMFDQTEFDRALSEVPTDTNFLYLHANIDNTFATGDHSLNLSKDQSKTLHDQGTWVICGHEHQPRQPFPRVVVIGNQIPTSVADCKGGQDKTWLQISGREIKRVPFWKPEGNYYDVTIELLDSVPPTAQFVRVHGETPKGEFGKVVQKINQYRSRSSSFVVSNAASVMVENQLVTAEQVTRINVVELLIQAVPEPFKAKVIACQHEEVAA